MPAAQPKTGQLPLLSVSLAQEPDVVTARQRARQVARLLGFDTQDQIRFATATSEIARNAFQYAGSGRVDFFVNVEARSPLLVVQVSDRGPGIADVSAILAGRYRSRTGMGLGISGTRRLMDHFTLESVQGGNAKGTQVQFGKFLPTSQTSSLDVEKLRLRLASEGPKNLYEELQQQNQELLAALEALRNRETELEQRQEELRRLNQELEETNHGVIALYAELDERAEVLKRANEIKSRFLSHMSHEFRTPLNSILALTSLLQRHTDGELTPGQEKQVGYVRKAAEELFEIVNDLLDLAKVESGKIELRNTVVELSQLFGTLRGMIRPLCISDRVSLWIEEPPGNLTLVTDEGKLAQILRNLLSNALKFTEHGEVRLSVQTTAEQLLFSVSDTGIGIAPEHQQFIFEDFGQIDSPIQRRVKGTGLGLPLSRKLAELPGGSLTVSSTPGQGSVFSLLLPRDKTNPISYGDAKTASEISEAGTILIIDDEEISRYLTRQLFRGTKHRLIEASNGIEGAESARFEQPKLILLDLTMPGQNGFDVLDELKSDPATRSIPIVIHTSAALRPEDLARLAGRQAAILPKQQADREPALAFIRKLLDEPGLFPSLELTPN